MKPEAEKTDVMARIAEASGSATSGVDESAIEHWVRILVMGREYEVPADLTIMQAMEYAGYRFVRGCGCRAGFCGACSTVYRTKGDYKLKTAMACQTRVEDGMFLVQIPFSPAEKPAYDINKEKYDANTLLKYWPELARCVSCNACTKACPQDLEVMNYVQAALRGDYERVSELSFDCIQCGLCALRCPAEIVQYHVAQLARRMYGKCGVPEEKNVQAMTARVAAKEFEDEFERLAGLNDDDIRSLYAEQQQNREIS